jgi:hypothetical protein
MKRTVFIVMALVALATAGILAQTATRPAAQKPTPVTVGPNFVDANGDGICDNFVMRGGRQGRGFGRGMAAGTGRRMGGGAGLAFGRNGESLVDVTARVTGMAAADVRAALGDGQTFAQIAEAHGKSAQDLMQSALTARQGLVDKAVADGRMTPEQAAQVMGQIKLNLEQCVSSSGQPRGRGPGRGFQGQCPMAGVVPAAPIKK